MARSLLKLTAFKVYALAVTLAALAACAVQAQQGPPITIEWRVAATGKPLEREATITLIDAQGNPVKNGEIEIAIDMPSMPMMHRIPKVVAKPTSEQGRYTARFTLEMAGEWAAQIELKRPQQARIIRRFMVD